MKIWLLEGGEKTGPFESYVVRDRIDSGELKAETLAWHPDADGWMRLDGMAQFESLFDSVEQELEEIEDITPPPLPDFAKTPLDQIKETIERELSKAPPLHMVRRFFARIHDQMLYMSLVIIVFKERALDVLQSDSILQFLPIGVAYVLLDGIMTHLWKSSPGKFLLGLRVTGQLGHSIPLGNAVVRSLKVWVIGFGMWIIWPVSLALSWFIARRFGYFQWDLVHRSRVLAKPFSGLHVVGYIMSIFALSALLNLTLPEDLVEEMNQRSGAQELLDKMK